MAIDTEGKKRSIVSINLYSVGPSILPDGSTDKGDKQAIGYSYSGELAQDLSPTNKRKLLLIT